MSSATKVIQASDMRAPSGSGAPTLWQRMAGTGTTGAENATALTIGEMATLLVGAVAVRFAFGATSAAESSATSPILGAYARFDWLVSSVDCFVSVEAADGASAFEAHVFTSSGARAGE